MKPLNLRVMLADAHSVVHIGIQHALTTCATISVTGSARNSTELIEVLSRRPCDVLVSGYLMPGGQHGDGLALFELLKQRYPRLKIVVLTMLENPGIIHSMLSVGINCILSKSDSLSHLSPAIHVAYANGRYLSPTINDIVRAIDRNGDSVRALSKRELEVIRLLVSGMTINEIAQRLHRSKKTISAQKCSAMHKLGLARDIELLRYALEMGLHNAVPVLSLPQELSEPNAADAVWPRERNTPRQC